MIVNLDPYLIVKDTGVEWMDTVPAHWELIRVKNLLSQRLEKGHAHEPLLAATQEKESSARNDTSIVQWSPQRIWNC